MFEHPIFTSFFQKYALICCNTNVIGRPCPFVMPLHFSRPVFPFSTYLWNQVFQNVESPITRSAVREIFCRIMVLWDCPLLPPAASSRWNPTPGKGIETYHPISRSATDIPLILLCLSLTAILTLLLIFSYIILSHKHQILLPYSFFSLLLISFPRLFSFPT